MPNLWEDIEIGDLVRSYDFKQADCYVEGMVQDIVSSPCYPTYKIKIKKRIFQGEEVLENTDDGYVYPPVNGTPRLKGVCAAVEKVKDEGTDCVHAALFIASNIRISRQKRIKTISTLLDITEKDAGWFLQDVIDNESITKLIKTWTPKKK